MHVSTNSPLGWIACYVWPFRNSKAPNVRHAAAPLLGEAIREAEGVCPSALLAEFHSAVGRDKSAVGLRPTLHDEEHTELIEALDEGDLTHIARELADVVYLAYGTAHVYGIDLDIALTEVHQANMHKAQAGRRRPDGKIIKPRDFVPPDMTRAVQAASTSTETSARAA